MNGIPENQKLPYVLNVIAPIGCGRKCTKCGKIKPIKEFYKNKIRKDGFGRECKKCVIIRSTISQIKHKEKRSIYLKKWHIEHPEIVANYWKKRKKTHPKEIKAYEKKRWMLEKRQIGVKKWCIENPEKKRAYSKKAMTKYYSTTKGKLHRNMKGRISSTIKRGSKTYRHWECLIGYTVEQLKKHLEKQFLPGMTWKNYGRAGWHIDHIIPVSVFNFNTPEDIDFRRCWALKNLQPLWAFDNISKNNKLNQSFQPSLSIGV